MRIALTILFLLSATAISAAATRVIDGDTVVIDDETIRIANIDTPEIRHAGCDAERRLGRVAKAELQSILSKGKITIARGDPRSGRKTDRYGRTLAIVAVDAIDVGQMLIDRDMARPWTGKRRPWCD
jgi:micrococcal nuclease